MELRGRVGTTGTTQAAVPNDVGVVAPLAKVNLGDVVLLHFNRQDAVTDMKKGSRGAEATSRSSIAFSIWQREHSGPEWLRYCCIVARDEPLCVYKSS